MNAPEKPVVWTSDQAAELYGIREWGDGLFDVSDNGDVTVATTFAGQRVQVPLLEIAQGLEQRGLEMPVLLRIDNHLDTAISRINETFAAAIAGCNYQGHYRGVFPIKVNQQSHIIEQIAQHGEKYHHGLEAGSKAELLIAMSMLRDPESLIVCNGYKDAEFIDLGLRAVQLGIACFFVVETLAELTLIIQRSGELGIQPLIGVRLKLSTKVDGHWSNDSGDRSLFGLTSMQLIEVVDNLKAAGMLHCLQLLHFHLGSQIPNIRNIRSGVQEACCFYIDLVREGAPLGYLDLGGGLAVDYDGSRANNPQSRNYSLNEYCIDVVEAIQESLDPQGIAHPHIVSESGRATVAYTSVLLFNILNVEHFDPAPIPEHFPDTLPEKLHSLKAVLDSLSIRNMQECYNDAVYYRDFLREQFRHGEISLRIRAMGDNLYLEVLQAIARLLPQLDRVPPDLENLQEQLADIYYGNFSVFQSLPDSWAIGQAFPVLPIHRLGEEPSREAIIADLTCDCDGKLDRFANPEGQKNTLRLHPLQDSREYYLGVFLVGAYQETLGDLHNLFGDTNVASIHVNSDGSYHFRHELQGDTIADVLTYVEYQPERLLGQFRDRAENAVRQGRISVQERQQMLGAFSESLRGYTYFER